MRFTFEGKEYDVSWEHHTTEGQCYNRGTICMIQERVPECQKYVVVEEAICHPNDNFAKETGRRVSLRRAAEVFVRGMHNKEHIKSAKKTIFDAYFTRKTTLKKAASPEAPHDVRANA